jgi:cytochrome c55X
VRHALWSPNAAFVAAVLAAFAAAAEPGVLPSPRRQTELGHLLDHDCGSCHGLTRRGGLGPALTPAALADRDDDVLADTILYGRHGTPMPPWNGELTRADARWLVDRLRGR